MFETAGGVLNPEETLSSHWILAFAKTLQWGPTQEHRLCLIKYGVW